MPQLFSNAAKSLLQSSLLAADTSLTLADNGSAFPVATRGTGTTGDWFKIVLDDGTNLEVVYVRTHTSGSVTFSNLLRGQEGTTARAWNAGAVVGLRLTAQDFSQVAVTQKYMGTATTSTTPTAVEGYYYLATTPGTYTNFGGLTVGHEIAYLRYTGTAWTKDVVSSLLKSGAVVGKVTSGWIHVKSVAVVGGVNTYTVEVGADTTVEVTSGLSSASTSTSTAYGPGRINVTAGEFTLTGEASQAIGTAGIAVRMDAGAINTGALVYVGSTVFNTDRLCLISYNASATASTQRSILPSNHFFSVSGQQQNPDTTQTRFHVVHYGATTFTDAVDNSAALFYAKWAAQVVNKVRKNLTLQFVDTTVPEIDIVLPPGTFLVDFSSSKYATSGVYANGYWSYFEGMRLMGSGIDTTTVKHTGGLIQSGIFSAEGLTLHRIKPGISAYDNDLAESRFHQVRFYFESADTDGGARIILNPEVKSLYLQDCEFDYRGQIYAPVEVIGYDRIVIEGCTFNPSGLGWASHNIYASGPNSKHSRYTVRGNRFYRGKTGAFTRLLNSFYPMVGTVIEDNYFSGIVEEAVALDGIGDSTSAPVIGNGLITSVEQPGVCPGEHQWLRWRTITPNNGGTWSTPVCLTNNTTGTAYAFQASAEQPSTPTGTDLVPSGWMNTIPIDSNPIWMSTAPITDGLAGTWTTPVDITAVRCFRTSVSQPTTPTQYRTTPSGWSLASPALPLTNVWVSKTHSVNGLFRGADQSWTTPVKIDTTPEEATWTEYNCGTTFSDTVAPDLDGATYSVWRNSPWAHNLVIGADLRRLSNNAVSIARSMENFFFTLDDGSGREGTVCPILYADPDTQKLTIELDAPADSINVGGWCGVHSGLFDSVVRNNYIENTTTAISLFMNIFGCLVENNKTLNCNTSLNLTGMLAQTYLRCRAHNNIVRGNTFIGMREESYYALDGAGSILAIENYYATNPEHRCFNNSVTDNTLIGGAVVLNRQGNLTWDNNRLIDVTEVRRTHCRLALPTANSAAAGQVVTRIQDDWDIHAAHAIPVTSMVSGSIYYAYRLGTTNWPAIFSTLSANQLPNFNTGYTYNGTAPTGTGMVLLYSFAATAMVAGGTYRVRTLGAGTNWSAIGAGDNPIAGVTLFTYNGVTVTGSGTVSPYISGGPASITYHACKLVNGVYSWVEV